MPPDCEPTRIVPFSPQAPPSPPPDGRSQMTCGEPALSSVRYSRPAFQNATDRPSGDQKGNSASAVLGSSRGVLSSNARIQRLDGAPRAPPSNTRLRPSG